MRVLIFVATTTRAHELAQAFMCPVVTGRTTYEEKGKIIERFNMDTPSTLVAVIRSMATGWGVRGNQPTTILFDDEVPEGPEKQQARARVGRARIPTSPYSDPNFPCGEIVLPGGGYTTLTPPEEEK